MDIEKIEATSETQRIPCSEFNKAPLGECAYCDRERALNNSFHPPHNASRTCCSGRRNHCSCDTCF